MAEAASTLAAVGSAAKGLMLSGACCNWDGPPAARVAPLMVWSHEHGMYLVLRSVLGHWVNLVGTLSLVL